MATEYGDITPRSAGFIAAELLRRGLPFLVFEKFGQMKPIPNKKTKSIIFRRYEALSPTPKELAEGVTPTAAVLTHTDITATLIQYGDRIQLTDVIIDTHEDAVKEESVMVLGEQAAEMIETVRFGIIKAGTNVFYANGSTRAGVNTVLTLSMQRRITRALKKQRARKITRVVRSTPDFGTSAIAPSFVATCHSDCEGDIRNIPGFVSPENYGAMTPWENEIGKIEDVRYLYSTVQTPFADAGGADGTTTLSTTGSNSDVYPILYFARDAYALVPLKGNNALTPMVVNPTPSDSDPMAQRCHISWKSMQTAAILQDLWMARGEVAVNINP